MEKNVLTAEDLQQLAEIGISPGEARAQINFLRRGVKYLKLNRPCTLGDGIVAVPKDDRVKLAALHDAAALKGRFMKFVPASGAASRMFVHWHSALSEGGFSEEEKENIFSENLHKFAFFPDLKQAVENGGENIEELLEQRKCHRILHYILTRHGLNYGHSPKALLKFHIYGNGRSRTPVEEHLVESALYTADAGRECRIHFTVSEEHLTALSRFLKEIKKSYEDMLHVTFRIGLSSQSPSTDTVALEGKKLCRDRSGRLVLRPGGHGALLKNLQELEGDVIFIKNIDNVVPDRLKPEVTLYKKVLGGYYISLEETICRHLQCLSKGGATAEEARKAEIFCREKLNLILPSGFGAWPLARRVSFIKNELDRPLRVCGVVKNEGEPGGGPFWAEEDGGMSLQIVESHQIDPDSAEQKDIWSAATHFNPVDLVCGVRLCGQDNFDLSLFADQKAVTLTEKVQHGKRIRVLEHPGLWNGAMARWNTVFVDVPSSTFNPVKTIDDLLRPQHLQYNT